MNDQHGNVEPVTVSDILGIDSWNRPRTNQELRMFIESRDSQIPDDVTLF